MTLLPDRNDDVMLGGLSQLETPSASTTADLEFEFPDQQPAPEPTLPEPAQPEPQQAAPVQPEPQGMNEFQQQVLDVLRQAQQPAAPQQAAPVAPPAWVDPAQRPENVQRMNDLLERMTFDETARQEFNDLQAQWNTERTNHLMDERLAQFQQQQMLAMQAPTLQAQAYQQISAQYGQALRQEHWNEVLAEVFNNDPAALASALNPATNPKAGELRTLLADAAAYRAIRTGAQPVPTRPTPPPTVQSQSRNPAPSRANNDMWGNADYVNSIIEQGFANPYKFSKGGGNQ